MNITARHQILIGIVLLALMILTRSAHFATLHSLPGASWAVFFLAGVYLSSIWGLPLFLGAAWGLDFAAFQFGNGSNFCLTGAYVALLPAYAALWFAGRWYSARHRFAWSGLPLLAVSAFLGALVCDLISSGSFYFFSGRFAEPTLAGFLPRIVEYFPPYLMSLSFWVGLAAVAHIAIVTAASAGQTRARA